MSGLYGTQPKTLPMARSKLIRLSFLDQSERNTVFWAWDAKDLEGGEYYITYRWGCLTISGPNVSIERQVGDEDDSTSSRNDIIALTSDVFDAELLESGVPCIQCRMAYPADDQPEECVGCGTKLRDRRLLKLSRAEHVMPQWIRGETHGQFVAWKGEDEYRHECWIVWSGFGLRVFGVGPDTSEESPFEITAVLGTPLPDYEDEALLAVLEVELVGVFDFKLNEKSVALSGAPPKTPGRSIVYHGVSVRWQDGGSEMFRYPTRELAEEAARYQFVENAARVRAAAYVGPRIDWGYLFSLGWLFQ